MNALDTRQFIDKVKKGLSKEYVTELVDAYLMSLKPANSFNAFDNLVADESLVGFPDRKELSNILTELLAEHVAVGGNSNSFSTMMMSDSHRISFNAADIDMTGKKVERANKFSISVSGTNLFAVLKQILAKAKEQGYNYDIDIPIMRDQDQGIIDTINIYCSNKELFKTIEFLNSFGDEITNLLSASPSKTMHFSDAITFDTFNEEEGKWSRDIIGENLVAAIDNVISTAVEQATIQVTVDDANYYNNEHDMTASYLYMKDLFPKSNVDFYQLVTDKMKESLKALDINSSNIFMPQSYIRKLYIANNAVPQITSPSGFTAANVIKAKPAQVTFEEPAPLVKNTNGQVQGLDIPSAPGLSPMPETMPAPAPEAAPATEEVTAEVQAPDGTPLTPPDGSVTDPLKDALSSMTAGNPAPVAAPGSAPMPEPIPEPAPVPEAAPINSNSSKTARVIELISRGPQPVPATEPAPAPAPEVAPGSAPMPEPMPQAAPAVEPVAAPVQASMMQQADLIKGPEMMLVPEMLERHHNDQDIEGLYQSFLKIRNSETQISAKIMQLNQLWPDLTYADFVAFKQFDKTNEFITDSFVQLWVTTKQEGKTPTISSEELYKMPMNQVQPAASAPAPAPEVAPVSAPMPEPAMNNGIVEPQDQLSVQGSGNASQATGMYTDTPVEVKPLEGTTLTPEETQAMMSMGNNQTINMDLNKYGFIPNAQATLSQPVVDLDGSTITLYEYLEKYNVLGLVPTNAKLTTPDGTLTANDFIVNNLARYVVTNGAISVEDYMELFNITMNAKEEKRGFFGKILGGKK